VNTVLRSLCFGSGDEILVIDHAYNACRNAVDFVASRSGAHVAVVEIPCPVRGPGEVVDAILAVVSSRTRLAMIDHVTSPTGMIFPIEAIVRALAERGIDTLVDGAHAPGMVEVDVESIGAAYYTGNCHKWICAPKGAGFLHVRRDRQADIRPLTISHGANVPRAGRSRFQTEFDWMGTSDMTPYYCVGPSIRYLETLVPGGWPEIRQTNRALALEARRTLTERVGLVPLAPPEMIGFLVSFFLPEGLRWKSQPGLYAPSLQVALMERFRIEVPIVDWPGPSASVIRVSAQLYNDRADYERLADALEESART
jgi:isopenicillin-N epimerase